MEAASSCKAVSSKSRRGCFGLIAISFSGTRLEVVACSTTSFFNLPSVVCKSVSIFCNRERIPLPSKSCFNLGDAIFL